MELKLAFTSALAVAVAVAGTAFAEDAPIIDLYTIGTGSYIFAHFGHSAICVTDARSPGGRCYNYGTADFSTPVPLTYEFIRGRALFWVSVIDRARMLSFYEREDRTVWRQRIPLAPEKAAAVAAALAASTAESEKYYRYHHFEDNCTTRIRDLLDRALGGALSADTNQVADGPSMRDFARRGFAGYPPLLVAATLVLGRERDKPTTFWEQMFLPVRLRDAVEAKLGAKPEVLYTRKGPPDSEEMWSGDVLLAGIGIALAVFVFAFGRTRRMRLALVPSGILLGLIGSALWFLAIFSAFDELRWNEVLLVLVPIDFGLLFFRGRGLDAYLKLRLAVIAVALVLRLAGVFVQPLWPAMLLAAPSLLAALQLSRAALRSAPRR